MASAVAGPLPLSERPAPVNGNLVKDDDGSPKVTIEKMDFQEYLWTQDINDTYDYWTTSFILPQFDEHGTEIEYYADTRTSIKFGAVDYVGSQFARGEVNTLNEFLELQNDKENRAVSLEYSNGFLRCDPGGFQNRSGAVQVR